MHHTKKAHAATQTFCTINETAITTLRLLSSTSLPIIVPALPHCKKKMMMMVKGMRGQACCLGVGLRYQKASKPAVCRREMLRLAEGWR